MSSPRRDGLSRTQTAAARTTGSSGCAGLGRVPPKKRSRSRGGGGDGGGRKRDVFQPPLAPGRAASAARCALPRRSPPLRPAPPLAVFRLLRRRRRLRAGPPPEPGRHSAAAAMVLQVLDLVTAAHEAFYGDCPNTAFSVDGGAGPPATTTLIPGNGSFKKDDDAYSRDLE
ncbi:Protein of unknown function [Gryllus bimaculatus]|nr:Protein of unknown function [Gryllus bimaculatus]